MKANAWNKSRITPPITNFLVLMFSIMAPAMAKGRLGAGGKKKMLHRARSSQEHAGGTSHLRPVGKRAAPPPSLLCSCLLTSKEEGGEKQESHDWEGLGFIPEQATGAREQSGALK